MQLLQQTVRGTGGTWRSVRARRSRYHRFALAVLVMALLVVPSLAFGATPHGDYTSSIPAGTSKCAQCHRPHRAATSTGLFSIEPTTGVLAQTALCLKCHGYAGPAANAAAGFDAALPSGHRVEDATGTVPTDLTNTCSSCHDAHTKAVGLPRSVINGQDVTRTAEPNSWCYACHDPDLPRNWSGATGDAYYDRVRDPASRDASGYPMSGTFRGVSAYQASAHASIPASATAERIAGDCLWCHASHRAPGAYDGLVAAYGPSSPGNPQATLCFRCHDQAAGGYGMGHVIQSTDASLTVGSPVPCYECHGAHGSRNGNTALISDALGQGLNPDSSSATFTVETQSQFCFTCHTSSEGWWWDSENGVMAPPEDIAQAPRQRVVGIDRLSGTLRLPEGVGAHTSTELSGCSCHGTAIHSLLGRPVSNGGVSCYLCHSTYEATMESGGADSASVYHHVMGTGASDGDTAFTLGLYPTSLSDLYCMSCHADHAEYNGNRAANLRADLTASAEATNTDYLPGGTYGICLSCHSASRPKDTANQAKDGLADTDTPKIVGGAADGQFGKSAHSYTVTSTFADASTFNANCAKCHRDEQVKRFQDSAGDRFSMHFSIVRRLLSALGGTPTDPLAEKHCYRCHSRPDELAGGKTAAEAGSDWYDAASMSAASEDVYSQFQLTSKHPVEATASGTVECESCHNAHVVQGTPGKSVTDPLNSYVIADYTSVTQQTLYCLNCHDANGGPTRDVSDTRYVPYTVTLSTDPADKMDKSLTGTGGPGHWSASGSISAGEAVACGTCHDNHGSDYPKLLGARNVTTRTNMVNGQPITGNDDSVCYACHTAASTSYPSFVRAGGATGYPVDGTWPGRAVYTGATAIHAAQCKTCHDVHGTANVYDELKGAFTATNYTLCFSCHNASSADPNDNIAQWYPVSAGGTMANNTDRTGHSGDAAPTTPCYNCHNPHGSVAASGLLVVTQLSSANTIVIGDATGEIDLSTGQGVRNFCFSCHLPRNEDIGWDGHTAAGVAVTNTAVVDGYNRVVQLKIGNNNPVHRTFLDAGVSCLQAGCHVSPHYPGT